MSRSAFLVATLLLFGSQAPASAQGEARAKDSRLNAPPGKLIDIGGYRLHLHCLGEGSPVVVLLSGGGGRAADFDLVQPAVARFTCACAYDRAGEGGSESGPLPRTLRQNAYELHTLLQKAGVNGPYVLAGQSYGVLAKPKVSVYVNDSKELSLVVEELNDRKRGGVGLGVEGGHLANLKITPSR